MFEEVGKRVEKVLDVAMETVERIGLEFSKLRLQVEDFKVINRVLFLKIFGYSYQISIYEDPQLQTAAEMEGVRICSLGMEWRFSKGRAASRGMEASRSKKGRRFYIFPTAFSLSLGPTTTATEIS